MSESILLEVTDLKRHYRLGGGLFGKARTLKAVDGVSFSLAAGRTLAVVGESGCGKSTLARMVTMIEQPTAGSLKIDGIELTTADAAQLKRKLRSVVQMVFQNPYGSLNPRKKVGSILEEPLIINTDFDAEKRQATRARHAGQGRPAARAICAISAYVFRRPAPAHRHRPRADAPSPDRGGRRAGLGPRRLDSRPGPEPADGSAGRVEARLSLHLPRSLRRPPYRRRGHGHVSRPPGGAGRQER